MIKCSVQWAGWLEVVSEEGALVKGVLREVKGLPNGTGHLTKRVVGGGRRLAREVQVKWVIVDGISAHRRALSEGSERLRSAKKPYDSARSAL